MQQDTPLTDLCSICHVNQIKYTCPRDGVHTCSLPCVKRHKQRAQCSGIRNPAEYRKRSELATPSSVDKDFNFITAVERSISRADDVVADKGIDLVPAGLRTKETRPRWEHEAKDRGIKLIRAPKGLSRSQQNKTLWNRQPPGITWTIEWLCHDGQSTMTSALETKPIRDLYEAAFGGRRNSRKRKRGSVAKNHHQERDQNTEDSRNGDSQEKSTLKKTISKEQSSDNTNISDLGPKASRSRPNPPSPDQPLNDAAKTTGRQDSHALIPPSKSTSSASSDIHFYLHRPGTRSRIKCLIPLSSSITLKEALLNRTLIEFPTIYVRNERADQLQSPFMTEEEYTRRHGVDIPINVAVPTHVEGEEDENEDLEEGEIVVVDENGEIGELSGEKVLEVLAKDLTS